MMVFFVLDRVGLRYVEGKVGKTPPNTLYKLNVRDGEICPTAEAHPAKFCGQVNFNFYKFDSRDEPTVKPAVII